MTWWAINAFCAQRFKRHGRRQSTKVSLILALQGFHIGMGWIGAKTDPTYWILKKR